jgi:tetratricopeptide (TPR) repeat protein
MLRVLCTAALLLGLSPAAADQWIEVKSAHFTITSNAGKGPASTLAWQLEQMRNEAAVIWPWAKVDLNKPLVVFVLKDEPSLKALAPAYWERKNGGNVATVWVSGYERLFLALRTDVEQNAKRHVNPYASSYFAYFSLILQQSVPRRLPPWFARGLAAVMSNTVIQDEDVLVGPPIPWYLDKIRGGRHIPIAELIAARSDSPLLKTDLTLFDAQAWALVHYLMFGEKGARSNDIARFASLVVEGTDADAAFRETLGKAADLELPISAYVERSLFAYKALKVDAAVKREAFAVTPVPPAEAAARRALFHAAMGRPVEARAAIDEARKIGGAPDAEVADALLLDTEDKDDAARAAFGRAVDAGTTDPYAHYRLASLLWKRDADKETLTRIQTLLTKAAALNVRYAAAYDFLAQVKADLGDTHASGLALRAVSLDPANARYRLTAAELLADEKRFDDALKQVQAAAELAESSDDSRQAAELRASIEKRKGG